MSNVVLKATNISKIYRIGAADQKNRNFREMLIDTLTSPVRNLSRLRRLTEFKDNGKDTIWALKDVSFDVEEGEVLGIIGRNGAGKSTLLKILSRITEPTTGTIEVYGRLSSLLEVGTGFHPELTGRENIFLNGAVLGMSRSEIQRKFDDIVDFAEIGKFIDTPAKRYSSGMYVRLAFAVAAHLEPDVLLVDEVLAVGDIAFQKKCLGKMSEVAKGGRTVLFVSHNMTAIRSLCQNVLWVDNGKVLKRGPTADVVKDYENEQIHNVNNVGSVAVRDPKDVIGKRFFVNRCEITNEDGLQNNVITYNQRMRLNVDLGGTPHTHSFSLEFRVHKDIGWFAFMGASGDFSHVFFDSETRRVGIDIGPLPLTSGKYVLAFSLVDGTTRVDIWNDACTFQITDCFPFAPGKEITEGACIVRHSFSKLD